MCDRISVEIASTDEEDIAEVQADLMPPPAEHEHPWPHLVEYFSIKSRDNQNIAFKCKLCLPKETEIKAHATSLSNLKAHVRRVHSHRLMAFEECIRIGSARGKKRASSDSSDTLSPTGSGSRPTTSKLFKQVKQPSISHLFESSTSYVSVPQKAVDEKIVKFFVVDMLPLQVVESEDFESLVKTLNPRKDVMSRRTLVRKIINTHKDMKKRLISVLDDIKWVATTADCWSAHKKSYLGMTAHWLNPETKKREKAVLACIRLKGRHTYDVLAQTMVKVHYDFHIENKVIRTTTDNGSNFVKAFVQFGDDPASVQMREQGNTIESLHSDSENDEEDLLSEPEDEREQGVEFLSVHDPLSENTTNESVQLPAHMRCAAHTFNLVASQDAKEAMNNPVFKKAYRNAMGKASALWNAQARSTVSADIIRQEVGKLMVCPNTTRWNSTYDAIVSLNSILDSARPGLQRAMVQLNVICFKDDDVQFFKEYAKVMSPVAIALDMVQREEQAYLGTLLPTIGETILRLDEFKSEDLVYCTALVNALLSGMKKRFENLLQDEDCQMAAAFHPRFRLTWLQNYDNTKVDSMRAMMEAKVEQALRQHAGDRSSLSSGNDDAAEDENFFLHVDRRALSEQHVGASKQAKSLVKAWLRKDVSKLHLKDAAFLNEPALIDLFVRYNTPIPSSAAVERLFSMAKDIMKAKRSSLSDRNFSILTFMKGNWRFLDAVSGEHESK